MGWSTKGDRSQAITVESQNQIQAALYGVAAQDEVRRIESKYSRYLQDSFLSEINRAAASGIRVRLDDETSDLLDYAFACYNQSDGLFDLTSGVLRRAWDFSSRTLPSVERVEALLPLVGMSKLYWNRPWLGFAQTGMELDFGGIAKEYAVDRAIEVLDPVSDSSVLVELSGDVAVSGPMVDGQAWRVGIQHPRLRSDSIGVVKLSGGALATSGDYERCIVIDGKRYCHLLNPMTGWPVEGLASVSVHAERCLLAGSLATLAMLKGASGPPWLQDREVRHHWEGVSGDRGGDLLAS